MIEHLLKPDEPAFSFNEVVTIAGIEAKQLRNFIEPGRAIIDVGTKQEDNRWQFSPADALLILVVSDLHSSVGLPPRVAASIARSAVPLMMKALHNLFHDPDSYCADIVCGLAPKDGQPELFQRIAREDGYAWRDLATGIEWKGKAPGDAPPISDRPHIELPIDAMVDQFARSVMKLRGSWLPWRRR